MFKISKGNSKLGKIYNWNLPAITTCRKNSPCAKDCYARKGMYNFPNVVNCYRENLAVYLDSPTQAGIDIISQLPKIGNYRVRIHSSGDIPDNRYLQLMVEITVTRNNGRYLAFTKQYEIVNDYLSRFELPENLTIVFSGWKGLKMDNPYNLPTAWVEEHGLHNKDAFPCSGKCDTCNHCWELKEGDQVVFQKH